MGSGASKPPPKTKEQTDKETSKSVNPQQANNPGQSSNQGLSSARTGQISKTSNQKGQFGESSKSSSQGTRQEGAPDRTVTKKGDNSGRQGQGAPQQNSGHLDQQGQTKMYAASGQGNSASQQSSGNVSHV
jgi:hypothetical protein